MLLSELARRLGANLNAPDQEMSGFTLDSREDQVGKVFVAIRGVQVDGHTFVPEVIGRGAVAALVEETIDGPHLLCRNVIESLANFGKSVRNEFSGPVVGITGSNGKTTTKEFVASALSPAGRVLKNPGNYNSEFTSPLTWFGLNSSHHSAVIEMGMRGFGQIAHLAAISRPTIGIITLIGTAHVEMVGDRAGIARAKGELLQALPEDGLAILFHEDDFLGDLKNLSSCSVRTFGFLPGSDCRVIGYRPVTMSSSEVLCELGGTTHSFTIPTLGRHNALNAAAALLTAEALGIDLTVASASLASTQLPPMRMEVREVNGAQVIVDNYNASPDSTIAALATLIELPCKGRRIALLGEMKELGNQSEVGHRRVGKTLASMEIDHVALLAGETRYIQDEAIQHGFPRDQISVYDSVENLAIALRNVQEGDLVLIKGSRALQMERVLEEVLRS